MTTESTESTEILSPSQFVASVISVLSVVKSPKIFSRNEEFCQKNTKSTKTPCPMMFFAFVGNPIAKAVVPAGPERA